MKEDKMENIHLIFKFLWYSVLFCIWGVSCTSSGTYKKTQMDIYMQYYDFIIDSLSKNPNYVCTRSKNPGSFGRLVLLCGEAFFIRCGYIGANKTYFFQTEKIFAVKLFE